MNIMENARQGVINQYLLAEDCFMKGDFEMGMQHFRAAELLEGFVSQYIPIEGEL